MFLQKVKALNALYLSYTTWTVQTFTLAISLYAPLPPNAKVWRPLPWVCPSIGLFLAPFSHAKGFEPDSLPSKESGLLFLATSPLNVLCPPYLYSFHILHFLIFLCWFFHSFFLLFEIFILL